jgi:hypothetical protein
MDADGPRSNHPEANLAANHSEHAQRHVLADPDGLTYSALQH